VLKSATHQDPTQSPPAISGWAYQYSGRVAKVGEEAQLRFIGYYPLCEWSLAGIGLRSTVHYVR
jgi:hypothetical protein